METLTLTTDEAAMLCRGYLDGMPGGNVTVHQSLAAKLERLRYQTQGRRAVADTRTIHHGKKAARV